MVADLCRVVFIVLFIDIIFCPRMSWPMFWAAMPNDVKIKITTAVIASFIIPPNRFLYRKLSHIPTSYEINSRGRGILARFRR